MQDEFRLVYDSQGEMMIPDEKQAAVTRALNETFGVNQYEELRPLTGGQSSALAFRMMVGGKPYLLKLMRVEIISDPTQEFACMKSAAETGIAPKVWYANVEDRVLITDFVEAKPYPTNMASLLAPILRTLHSLPNFPKPGMGNYIEAMDGFVRRFQAARLLPENATEEIFQHYADLMKVYPHNEMVASHNDLKPQNMVFDGEHLWLVDWESAFLNDPYVDLAIVANFFIEDEAAEADFLNACLGEPADEYKRARFYLMRQMLHMFYAALFMALVARTGMTIDPDMSTALDFRTFHQHLIADEINTLQPDAQVQYAKLHLNEALKNMRTQRFADALALVGHFHAIA